MRNSRIAQLFMLLILTGTVFAQNRTDSVHVASYTINLSITDFVGSVFELQTPAAGGNRVDCELLQVEPQYTEAVNFGNYPKRGVAIYHLADKVCY